MIQADDLKTYTGGTAELLAQIATAEQLKRIADALERIAESMAK